MSQRTLSPLANRRAVWLSIDEMLMIRNSLEHELRRIRKAAVQANTASLEVLANEYAQHAQDIGRLIKKFTGR